MTDSYNQSDINLRDASPITVTTPDDSPVTFLIDVLTNDGNCLAVDMYGGGSDPAAVNTNNYVVLAAVALFSREAGVGIVQPGGITVVPVGIVPILSFTVVNVPGPPAVTQCFLTITPAPLSPAYNHHLKISKIRF